MSIQVVSSYLIKQRGEIHDPNPDPSKVRPKYVRKNKFKQWILWGGPEYYKYLFFSFMPSDRILECFSTHNATLFDPYYEQIDKFRVYYDPNAEYVTKEFKKSAAQLTNLTWGYKHSAIYTCPTNDGSIVNTDEAIRVLKIYTDETELYIPLMEERVQTRTAGVEPEPIITSRKYFDTFALEYYECPYVYPEWLAKFFCLPMNVGFPVFTTFQDGRDYCACVKAYLNSQTDENYEAVCNAIDKCINPQ